jgi:hypothetical protein
MVDDDVLGGVNFASGGAGILNETGVYFVSRIYRIIVMLYDLLLLLALFVERGVPICRFSTSHSTSRYRASRWSRRR